MRKFLFSLSVSCFSLSFAAVPASAQQSQPQPDAGEDALAEIIAGQDGTAPVPPEQRREIVFAERETSPDLITVTATGFSLDPENTGQSVTVIGRDELVQIQGADLTRVFARLPGVTFVRNGPIGSFTGLKVSVFLEVEGAAHYLPAYAGNLDIMTSAALKTAEKIALRMNEGVAA